VSRRTPASAAACCGTDTTTRWEKEKRRPPTTLENTELSNREAGRGGPMKAVRLHEFHSQHIIEGQWDAAMGTPLPYILGHENAGWVHEVGSAVTNVAVGDTVILHPTPT